MNGSADYTDNFGTQVQIASTADAYTAYDIANATQGEPHYRARFYVNPNSINMITDTDILDLFTGYNGTTQVFTVQMRKTASSYQIRSGLFNDAGTWVSTSWYNIPNAWTAIEIDYQALINSGSLTLWIDDTSKQTPQRCGQ